MYPLWVVFAGFSVGLVLGVLGAFLYAVASCARDFMGKDDCDMWHGRDREI